MADAVDDVVVTAFLGAGPQEDPSDLERELSNLNQELWSLGTVLPAPTAPAPDGTRGVDLAAVGAVCVAVLPVLPDLLAVVRILRDWVGRGAGRTVKAVRADGSRIELTGLSEQDVQALVTDWIDRRPSS
ncbi:hypothetical protein ACIBO1_24325 [Micromonospora sp. NPDC049903]|uniref:hypothetical protein n=1 Tax=Micromonospora sp. NPDC049903 TaxID=3364276 RepID=UPI00379C6C34